MTKEAEPSRSLPLKKAVGISIPAGFLLLFALRYRADVLGYLFNPSYSSLPAGIEVNLVEGQYEAGTGSDGQHAFADLSFRIKVANVNCHSCGISLVAVDVSERRDGEPFSSTRQSPQSGQLSLGEEMNIGVSIHDPPAVALRKVVKVELFEGRQGAVGPMLGNKVIPIPGLTEVDEIWKQTSVSGGRAVIPFSDR